MAAEITNESFEQEVKKSELPVIVDFWASWCGPCMMLAPAIQEISDEYSDKVKVVKVNVDEEPALAMEYGITSIPTLILFENGEVVKKSVGYSAKEEIIEEFNL